MTTFEVMEEALRLLLVQKGILSDDEIARQIDAMDSRSPALGAKVVARAWTDPGYKVRLMGDARSALAEIGVDIGALAEFKVIENTPETHNVVVCTLCSCYPWPLLGLPPNWYKDPAYRSRVVREPRTVLAEMGLELDPSVAITVWDSSAENRYFVLPQRPPGTDDMSEEERAALVTREAMVGVSVVASPGGAA